MSDEINITHNVERSRYELRVGGELASIADYSPTADQWVFDHTETAPRFGGRGLAAQVVRAALDDVRERGVRIVPSCWFVAKFVDENPEYADLVA